MKEPINISQIKSLERPQTAVLFALSFTMFKEFLSRMHDAKQGYKEKQYRDCNTLDEYIPAHHGNCTKMPLLNPDMWDGFVSLLPIYGSVSVICLDTNAMTVAIPRYNPGVSIALIHNDLSANRSHIGLHGAVQDLGDMGLTSEEKIDIKKFQSRILSKYEFYLKSEANLVVVTDEMFEQDLQTSPWHDLYEDILSSHKHVIYAPCSKLLDVYDMQSNLKTVQGNFDREKSEFYEQFTS